ncbi:MAG TPA: recombinase A [Kofleriaceae bacterium]|nr:recombinase A [Kofleriaceae bacterium]
MPARDLKSYLVSIEKLARVAEPAGFARAQLTGRLIELSAQGAGATTTAAMKLVRGAQEEGEPVAWIALPRGSFYPPDVADSGIDLDALVIVRAGDGTVAARAAEKLLRSGAFGLIVIDLGADADVPMAHQGRLVTLAQQHDAAVVFLTEKSAEASSLGSLISLRLEAMRVREASRFACAVRALKDKRRGPGWTHEEKLRGPAGMESS